MVPPSTPSQSQPQTQAADPQEKPLSDRELLVRVDQRSMEVHQNQTRIITRMEALEKSHERVVQVVEKVRDDVRGLKAGKKHSQKEIEQLAEVVDELEDTKVRDLRELVRNADERSRYWTRWAIGLAATTIVSLVGAVLAYFILVKK